MKRTALLLSILFILISHIPILAQKTEQTGWVTELNSGKKALPGVQIEFDDAPSTTSDDGGKFVLSFLEKKYGDIIFMSAISKSGFELVNEKELQYPTLSSDQIKIVLCKKGLLDQMRAEYYNLSKEAINKGYQEQLQHLKLALKEKRILEKDYGLKVRLLQEQLMKSEERATELSEKYARTNFDDVSTEYRQAFEQFKMGNLNETLAILDKVNLPQRLKKRLIEKQRIQSLTKQSKTQIAENELGIKQDMQTMKLAADMYNLKMDFNKANNMYENLVALDSTHIDNTLAYAYFSLIWKRHQKAKKLFKKTYSLSVKEKDMFYMGYSLKALGIILNAENNFEESIKVNNKAIEFITQIKVQQPNTKSLAIVNCYNIIGNSYKSLGKFYIAFETYLKALDIVLEIGKSSTNYDSNATLIPIVLNISICSMDMDEYQDAYTFLKEALILSRNVENLESEVNSNNLLQTLTILGQYYYFQNDFNQAAKCYAECIEITERFVKKMPLKYLPLLSQAYMEMGYIKFTTHDLETAHELLSKATKITRTLVLKNPDIYLEKLAQVIKRLAKVYQAEQNFEKALSLTNESLQISLKLSEKSPGSFDADRLFAHNSLFSIYFRMKQFNQALSQLQLALKIAEDLAKKFPSNYTHELTNIYSNLGALYKEMNKLEKSIHYETLAIKNYKKIAQTAPDKYWPYIATATSNLGLSYLHQHNLDKAITYTIEAKRIYEKLALKRPKIYQHELAKTLGDLSQTYFVKYAEFKQKEDLTKGINSLDKAVQAIEPYKTNSAMAGYVNYLAALESLKIELSLSNKGNIERLQKQIEMLINQPPAEKNNQNLSKYYRKKAWYQLLDKNINGSERAIVHALEYDSNSIKAKVKLAYIKLLQGKFEEAKSLLMQFKDRPYPSDFRLKTFKDLYLIEFKELEEAGMTNANLSRMKTYLIQN